MTTPFATPVQASRAACQSGPDERIYGQPDADHVKYRSRGTAPSAQNLDAATSVIVDRDGNLKVAEPGRRRIVMFPAGSTTATRVYGQPDFTSGGGFADGSTSSLHDPIGLALAASGNLYVADGDQVVELAAGQTTPTRTNALPTPDGSSASPVPTEWR